MFNSWIAIFMILNLDLTALPCIEEMACTGAIIMEQLRWIGGTADMAKIQGSKEIKCFPNIPDIGSSAI